MALGPVIQGLVALSTVIAKNFARIKKMKDTKERAELVKKTDKDLQDLDRQAGNVRLKQSDATKFIDDLEGQKASELQNYANRISNELQPFRRKQDKKKQLELLAKLKKKYPGSNDID